MITGDCLKFEGVEIFPVERKLVVHGYAIPIGARAFDVLMVLALRHPQPVSKKELMSLAWPQEVDYNNIEVQILGIRKALGRSVVATIPGKGYQLTLARIESSGKDEVPPPAEVTEALRHSSVVGRSLEIRHLVGLIKAHALVTVLGAGGVGKTTLATEVCGQLAAAPLPVLWVNVSLARTSRDFIEQFAAALGIAVEDPPVAFQALADAAARKGALLLVLDNAEHLVPEISSFVQAASATAPSLKILVTSQAPLRMNVEQIFRLGPLGLPDRSVREAAQALKHAAVVLFNDHAHACDHRWQLNDSNAQAVVRICQRVGGLPLALKLAAARVPLMGIARLEEGLSENFSLLSSTQSHVSAHQRTIHATLAWSYGLLAPDPQSVLRAMAVFPQDFKLEDAVRVAMHESLDRCSVLDALGELVDRSLIALQDNEGLRYKLPQTTREYALERLKEIGEVDATNHRLAQAMTHEYFNASQEYFAKPVQRWLAQYAPEIPNLLAALDWATDHQPLLAIRLVGQSYNVLKITGFTPLARRICKTLEAHAGQAPNDLAAKFWVAMTTLQDLGLHPEEKQRCALKAQELCVEAGELQDLYCMLASLCVSTSDLTLASTQIQVMKSIEQPDWPPRLRRLGLSATAYVLRAQGNLQESLAATEEACAMVRTAGDPAMWLLGQAWAMETELVIGNLPAVKRRLEEILKEENWKWRGLSALALAANVYLVLGDCEKARLFLEEFIQVNSCVEWEGLDMHSGVFALAAAKEGRLEDAAQLIGYHDKARPAAGGRFYKDDHARNAAMQILAPQLDACRLTVFLKEGSFLQRGDVWKVAVGQDFKQRKIGVESIAELVSFASGHKTAQQAS